MTQTRVPLRIDLAGGWLDVPRFARPGAFVVNLAIQPLIGLEDNPYQRGSGLGGSAAHAILYPTRELRDASGLIRVEPYLRTQGC